MLGSPRLLSIGCWLIAAVIPIGCAEDRPTSNDLADRFNALVSEASELLSPFILLHGVEARRPDKEQIFRAIALYDEALSIIRRALMIACRVHDGEMAAAAEHVKFLDSFAPDFIPSVLRGDLALDKMPEHNALLADGLRAVGSPA